MEIRISNKMKNLKINQVARGQVQESINKLDKTTALKTSLWNYYGAKITKMTALSFVMKMKKKLKMIIMRFKTKSLKRLRVNWIRELKILDKTKNKRRYRLSS